MLTRLALIVVFINFVATAADNTKPADESAQQRAARLLNDAARQDSVHAQSNQQAAEQAYQSGLKLMNELEYEEARVYFERALALAPGYSPARMKLHMVESLLGIHTQRIAQKMRELEGEERVHRQEALITIENLIAEARRYEEKGSLLPYGYERTSRADILAEQLKNLKSAQERLLRAKELINWLPPNIQAPAEKTQVEDGLKRLGK